MSDDSDGDGVEVGGADEGAGEGAVETGGVEETAGGGPADTGGGATDTVIFAEDTADETAEDATEEFSVETTDGRLVKDEFEEVGLLLVGKVEPGHGESSTSGFEPPFLYHACG